MPDFLQEWPFSDAGPTPCWYVHDIRTATLPISAGREIVNTRVDESGWFPAVFLDRGEAQAEAKRSGANFAPEEISGIPALVQFLEEIKKANHRSVIFTLDEHGKAYGISDVLIAGLLASDAPKTP